MNEEIKILDVIVILKDLPDTKIKKGFVGTIVEQYSSGYYEVEFSDDKGHTIDFAELNEDEFIVLRNLSANYVNREADDEAFDQLMRSIPSLPVEESDRMS